MSIQDQLKPTGQVEQLIPEPLDPTMASETPYPLDSLPPLMRNAVTEIADFAQVPLALAGQCVLGAAAYLAQTRVDAWSHKSYQMPCSINSLALGISGSGKSSAHDLAFRPIMAAERELKKQHAREVAEIDEGGQELTGKQLAQYNRANPKPPDPSTIIGGDGSISRIMAKFVEGTPSLFWSTDEGGQMLGGHSLKADNSVAVLGCLTQLWDSGKGERLRSSANEDASGTFWGRRLSLHLMAQERAIRDVLADDVMREQGFLPRFLFCAPDSIVGTRLMTLERMIRKPEDCPGIVEYWKRVEIIMQTPERITEDGEVDAERLELTKPARTLWLDFHNEVETQQGRFGRYAELTPFASRGAQNALRVATVIAHFEGKNHVDDEAMAAAIALVDHSLSEWLRYACAARVDASTQAAINMSDWLIKQIEGGKTDWLEFTADRWGKSGYAPLRTAAKRDAATRILLEKKHLTTADGKTFKVNPLLIGAESADFAESLAGQGLQVADDLRTSAEKVRTANSSAENPQPSANNPQSQARMNKGFPQNPQNPQPIAPADEWTGTI